MKCTVIARFDNNPILIKISNLPGVTERALKVDNEVRYSTVLYGKTRFDLKCSDQLVIEHLIDCISRKNGRNDEKYLWQQITEQRNLVWATLSGQVVGYLELWHNSENRDDSRFLGHPFAWAAHHVFVLPAYRRKGIGRKLYAHVREYSYEIQPVGGSAPGDALWSSMHPDWKSLIGSPFDFSDPTVLPTAESRFACGQKTPPFPVGSHWWNQLRRNLLHQ